VEHEPLTFGRSTLRVLIGVTIAAIVGAACGTDNTLPRSTPAASASGGPIAPGSIAPGGSGDPLTELVAAAEQEGGLTTIGLSDDWCNYGEIIKTFEARYAITVNELHPDAGFADQLAAIKANKATKGPEAPDVIDVGQAFGVQAKHDKLIAPYKVATWATLPKVARDPDGFWSGNYYAVLAFETNTTSGATPPTDWATMLGASYINRVALAGDPRLSDQAIQTVYAAALANGGSLANPAPGLDFFAKLQKAGNLIPLIATPNTIDIGSTPVTVRWTWSSLAHRERANGTPAIDVTVPETGRLGSFDVEAISAYAPHPNAARLWMEFLYTDEVQNLWLKGNCIPMRFDDLTNNDSIPPDVLADVPDVAGAVFPSLDQLAAASALITQKWNAVVGVDIR
jgi:putative spermidine/putrescine transport system substrate-binding protein